METLPSLNEEVIAQLVSDVGYETALELCQMFADDARQRVAHMTAMGASGHIEEILPDAHSLKSLSYTYGTQSLGDKSRQLESICKAGDTPNALRHVTSVEEHVSPSLRLLFDYLQTLHP